MRSFALLALAAIPLVGTLTSAQPLVRQSLTDLRVPIESPGASPRQNGPFPPGSIITMRDELENFPVDVSLGGTGVNAAPTSFTGPDGFDWGLNTLRGQNNVAFVRVRDLVGSPVGGNATKALQIRTAAPQASGTLSLGANLTTRNPVEPLPGSNARLSTELYISTIAELYTLDARADVFGSFTGRLRWGGACVETYPGECTNIGLPAGPLQHVYIRTPSQSPWQDFFLPARYCVDEQGVTIPGCTPPPGFQVGSPVPPPIGAWSRFAFETTADGRVLYLLDRLDGSGEVPFFSSSIRTSGYLDGVGFNSGFESQDAFLLVDNFEMSGPLLALPKPPPLECAYFDDLEWLNRGRMFIQTGRWLAALSSAATVVERSPGDQAIRQINNVSSDDKHRVEMTSTLPNSYALPGDPWTFCVDVATTGQTVRAITLDSEATNYIFGGVTARVFLGRADLSVPNNPAFDPTVYVQVDPWYDPIDDPFTTTPYDNAPTPGVEIVSTGYQWVADDAMRTLCFTIENDRSMTIAVDGVEIYSGVAFANAAQIVRFESENNSFGWNSRMEIDNLSYACLPLPVVTLPDLTSPIFDDFAWGVANVPPSRHIDDPIGSPLASTRFTSANGVVTDGQGGVVMANVFRDTVHFVPPLPPGASDANLFAQFSARTPSLPGGSDSGWTVVAEFESSEWGVTSRGWSPLQARPGGGFSPIGYLWHLAPNDTFYLFGRQEGATQPGVQQFVVIQGPTRAALGLVAGEPYAARVQYDPDADRLDWFVNDQPVGSTFPLLDTNPINQSVFTARNLDAFVVWSGDDETAPTDPPSTLTLRSMRVFAGDAPCPGDTNSDGVVNFIDLNAVLSTYGQAGADLPADINADGVVNFTDLNAVLAAFGTSCD